MVPYHIRIPLIPGSHGPQVNCGNQFLQTDCKVRHGTLRLVDDFFGGGGCKSFTTLYKYVYIYIIIYYYLLERIIIIRESTVHAAMVQGWQGVLQTFDPRNSA